MFVRVANAHKRSADDTRPLVVNGAKRYLDRWNFGRNQCFTFNFRNCEKRTYDRLHLIALLRYLVLEVLCVIDATKLKLVMFVQAKDDRSP